MTQRFRSRDEQRRAYLTGEWGNPLTTIPVGGRILSAMQLPWFTLMPPRGYGVLTTNGRKTGKKRRKCVRVIRTDDRVYLVSLRGPYGAWMRNIHAHPRVSLRVQGGTLEGLPVRSTIHPSSTRPRRSTAAPSIPSIDFRSACTGGVAQQLNESERYTNTGSRSEPLW